MKTKCTHRQGNELIERHTSKQSVALKDLEGNIGGGKMSVYPPHRSPFEVAFV